MRSLIEMAQRILSGELIGRMGKGGVTSQIPLFNLIFLNRNLTLE
jgi:hypothetical protein